MQSKMGFALLMIAVMIGSRTCAAADSANDHPIYDEGYGGGETLVEEEGWWRDVGQRRRTAGYGSYGSYTSNACFDFSSESSLTGGSSSSCTACIGSSQTECTTNTASCNTGYHTYDASTGTCAACTASGSCASGTFFDATMCTGSGTTDDSCTACAASGSCASGTFFDATTCTGSGTTDDSCTEIRFCTLDDIACSNDGHVAGDMGDYCFCVCHEGFTGSHCEIGNSLLDCEGTPGGDAVIDACGVCGGDSSACAGLCTLPTFEAAASQFVPLQLQQCIDQSRCTYRNGACEERYPCSGTSKKKCGARVDCEWDFIGPNSCTTRLQPLGCTKKTSMRRCGKDNFCLWNNIAMNCDMHPCHGKNKDSCTKQCGWSKTTRTCFMKN